MNRILVVLTIFLASCTGSTNTSYNADTPLNDSLKSDGTITDTASAPKTAIKEELKAFSGLYIKGDKLNAFRDCQNPSIVYTIEDKDQILAAAYDKTKNFLSYPDESIYVEVKGYLQRKSDQDTTSKLLVIKEVSKSTQKNFATACFNYEFIGLGTEPFWSLEIIPFEKLIVFKDAGAEKTYLFPYSPGKANGNAIVYQSTNGKNETLKAVITKQQCSDGMSDRRYNYSVNVTLNNKKFTGCAIKKGDKLSSN